MGNKGSVQEIEAEDIELFFTLQPDQQKLVLSAWIYLLSPAEQVFPLFKNLYGRSADDSVKACMISLLISRFVIVPSEISDTVNEWIQSAVLSVDDEAGLARIKDAVERVRDRMLGLAGALYKFGPAEEDDNPRDAED